ncbi:hypothetical protein ON058_03410 [Demequina sp. B12]|uniref:hypothetical protein n=1 Tax=Demequina sp. B12 TaxID=2992757 RepID=UPI00237A5781|nr:hypothetical protein [Demequina sp. B12]MDE0572456.1 hypothetical protein [Demequina sp. B12]
MGRQADDGSWSRAYLAGSGLSMSSRSDGGEDVRHIAEGAELPRERVVELAKHRDARVREAVARRDDVPFGALASLAHDTRPAVRIAVASHPRAGSTVLAHLAADRDPHVVKAVIRNPRVPQDLLARLTEHRREEVRVLARKVRAELDARDEGAPQQALPVPWVRPGVARLHASADAVPEEAAAPAQAPQRRHAPAVLAPRPVVGERAAARPEARPAPLVFVPHLEASTAPASRTRVSTGQNGCALVS